jgi:putative nucleotidyltransferase with HDIG domain
MVPCRRIGTNGSLQTWRKPTCTQGNRWREGNTLLQPYREGRGSNLQCRDECGQANLSEQEETKAEELLDAGDLGTLRRVQRALVLSSHLSLALLFRHNAQAVVESHPADKLQPFYFPKEVVLPDWSTLPVPAVPEEDKFHRLECEDGLTFLIHPFGSETRDAGWIVAGPVPEKPLGRDKIQGLADALDAPLEDIDEALACHPSPVPLDLGYIAEILETLADLAVHLCHERRQRARDLLVLKSLYEVGSALGTSLRLEDVLKKVMDESISLLGAENGSLMLVDEIRSELKMLVAQGLDEQIVTTTRVNLGEGISGWVAKEGQPRLLSRGVRDIESNKGDREELESAMCVPLKSKDRCIGVLNLSGRTDGEDFTQDDLKILSILASHAASAIDIAQLYQQVTRQVSQLEALYQLGRILNSSLSLDDILPTALTQTLDLLEAKTASVMLLDEKGEELRIRLAHGLPPDIVSKTKVKLGERVSGRVAASGEPVLIIGSEGDDMDSSICVPLLANQQVLGVLNIRTKADGSDFTQQDLELASQLANIAAAAIENASLHDELQALFLSTVSAMANSIDARDPYTKGHSERVTSYAVMIAEQLKLSAEELERLRYAGLLHDIGKIRIRDHILHKPGRLTDAEFTEMKKHPEYGVEIMEPVKAFQTILPAMLHHHERFDGRGYPHGLEGHNIPLSARILCVADCFDAMTSDRPYRKGMPVQAAVNELYKNKSTQFDPELVDIFLALVDHGRVEPVLEAYREGVEGSESKAEAEDENKGKALKH